MSKKHNLVNRDISWLTFNGRVLQEAECPDVPLVERMRFLGIFSNNLDEFFRVRVATTRRLLVDAKGAKKATGDNPRKILDKIQKISIHYQVRFDAIFRKLKEQLQGENIYFVDEHTVCEQQVYFLRRYFVDKIAGFLSPVMLKNVRAFPELVDKSIYLAVKLSNSSNPSKVEYALIEVPTKNISRFIILPSEEDRNYIILLEDVIRLNLDKVFGILPYDTFEAYIFKITRDAELDMDNDISEGFLEKIERSVSNRKKGEPVRFVYDASIAPDLFEFLTGSIDLDYNDNIIAGGRYHNFKDFIGFPDFGNPRLVNNKLLPVPIPELDSASSIMEVMAQHDFMLHFPFQNFSYFIKYLQEAAIDPKVSAIYITLYRVSTTSKVVNALMNAAQNGKKVTVVVELQARFDEQANIYWSKKMQEGGVNVIFGVPGLKVHSKLTLIVRSEGNKEKLYATVGTGNFHEGNASLYTDVTLFTADPRITNEVMKVFSFIEFNYKAFAFRHLLVSPFNMRRKINALIAKEIANAKAKKPAYIICKINHLVDEEMINRLYEASQAGVKIKMSIRGTCSLIPGVKGLSENIEVYAIIDRYLEHSRIFFFANGGDELCYISSADWMTRNLDRRVEVAVPILDKGVASELRTIVDYALMDNVKSRVIDEKQDNRYKPRGKKEAEFHSQLEIHNYYLHGKVRKDDLHE